MRYLFFIAMKGDDRLAAKKNPLADEAYELYKNGMKLVDIADQLGKPEGTIRRWKNTYDWDNERSECKANESERLKRTENKKNEKKLTSKQEAFAAEYIKNGGNAAQAAKAAGYSKSTAKNAVKKLVENDGVSQQIAEQMERIEKEQHRDIMSLAEIQERRSMIAKGMLRDGEGYTPEFKDQLKAMDGLEKALTIAEKQRIEREEKEKREKAPLWTIPITDITSDFVEIYRTVHEAFAGEIDVHEIVSKGGRGSIKSNFWGDLAYETIRQDPQAHIVYTRRYKVDLRGSVYNQFMKTVIRYNDLDNWDFKQSPMCAVYKPTGQTVMFVGADKPISLKSFNVPFGYVKMLIHEECDEMAGVEQMDNIEDTFLRSDTPALDIKIFNPPKSKNNFMNEYVEECRNKPQTRICHSYYYNVPVKWLGKRFFERAEWFKVHKPLYYRNNYMGEVTGTGGGIFDNVEERTITDAEIENMPFFYHGLDFGFEHPQTFQKAWYDEDMDTLYCVDEVYAKKCKNSTFARKIKKYITEEIICDSARPDAIAELQDWGFNAIGAKKRWGSGKGRDYCWEWLQQTTKIVVDPERCPHLAHELTTLEHEQLADGSFSDAYPKIGEDCTMALIYGLNRVIMESRRNNGLYDDEIDEDEEEEDDGEYED
jgi:PBSX family phage terminase large subunit|nr:MAG TPA: terminase large subunit [Caudoviricetes sp.]